MRLPVPHFQGRRVAMPPSFLLPKTLTAARTIESWRDRYQHDILH